MQDETVILSTRVILVDALVQGIDRIDAASRFQIILRELSVFLSVVMQREVSVPSGGRVWVWTSANGQLEICDIRNLGYYEQELRSEMPQRAGEIGAITMRPVARPDFTLRGVTLGDTELQMPADITGLWQTFAGTS